MFSRGKRCHTEFMNTRENNPSAVQIDLSLPLDRELLQRFSHSSDAALFGHVGTHFDAMDKTFPLAYTECPGVVFDVSAIRGRQIELADIDPGRIRAGYAVLFHTGFLEEKGYGSEAYHKNHPQLSYALIDALLCLDIALIGIDAAGIRRGKEHTPADQYCADHNVFVVENLCNLGSFKEKECILVHTYPMNLIGFTGIPCRVIAEKL